MPDPEPNQTLDCLGLFCPIPVFQTRQALDKLAKGEILEVLVDDPAAEGDIPSLAKRLNVKILKMDKDADRIRFLLEK
ncbi:sulfurtransferase TusA family protein [Candidatus Bathyarchaeota archaeon]|nr:sulfurtransferase TusA family protein [Candidatus Bathyarchaeota archaeon]